MKKRVLIHELSVSFADQRVHFQINLPRDATKITAVHHSLILKTGVLTAFPNRKGAHFYDPTIVIGDLRLQAFERAGWFYVSDVTSRDLTLTWGDPSIADPLFTPSEPTHSLNNFLPESVLVDAPKSTVINGHYFDRLGKQVSLDVEYRVRIYIEVELKNCER